MFRNLFIFIGMLFCLFTPSIVFTIVGYKSMESLGNRPSGGARVMIPLAIRLLVTAAILLGVLIFLLRTYLR